MKKEIRILDFIKTGKFGGVVLGMTDKEVEVLLGPPKMIHESEDTFIFFYGSWEIHFLRSDVNKVFSFIMISFYTIVRIMMKYLLLKTTMYPLCWIF